MSKTTDLVMRKQETDADSLKEFGRKMREKWDET